MTPFLLSASTGMHDVDAHFVLRWNGTNLAFHTTGSGKKTKNVLQLTKDAGGDLQTKYGWLNDNCRGEGGKVLQETSGESARAPEEKTWGSYSKAVRVATRLNTTKGGSKGGSNGSSHDDGNKSSGTKKNTEQVGNAAKT